MTMGERMLQHMGRKQPARLLLVPATFFHVPPLKH